MKRDLQSTQGLKKQAHAGELRFCQVNLLLPQMKDTALISVVGGGLLHVHLRILNPLSSTSDFKTKLSTKHDPSV